MTSPIVEAQLSLLRRLNTLTPSLPVSYEGIEFVPPQNQAYLRVQFIIQDPQDPVIGDMYYREQITMQVFVNDLLDTGTFSAIEKAESIRQLFKKGTTLVEGTTEIHILSTPKISGVIPTTERLVVPIMIDTLFEVYKE